ncbi:hypothetical protein [Methylosinus sp. C49]|nr:hypothetical protein [Methylosinus sp. C49]
MNKRRRLMSESAWVTRSGSHGMRMLPAGLDLEEQQQAGRGG